MSQEIKTDPEIEKATSPPAKISYEEFLAQSDEDTYAEWVDGEVIEMSPASDKHQETAGFLYSLLQHFVETKRLGAVRIAPFQMKTGPDLPGREPDVLFIANENLDRRKANYLSGPADLVIEVISPESRARDRGAKFYEYEQGGVREYWLIDHIRRQAEFYQLGEDGIYRLISADSEGIYRSAVLRGLWLKVEWLWQEPLPLLMDVLRQWGLV
jgi:Uma2 family endonuclease